MGAYGVGVYTVDEIGSDECLFALCSESSQTFKTRTLVFSDMLKRTKRIMKYAAIIFILPFGFIPSAVYLLAALLLRKQHHVHRHTKHLKARHHAWKSAVQGLRVW